MSKDTAAGNPPPYSDASSPGGQHFPPQNAVYPTQPTTPGQPPGYPGGYPGGYAYPVQPGYGQAYGAQQANYSNTTTIVNQPMVTVLQVYRETPVRTNCPHCQADVVTATYYETGTFTWVACFVICMFICWLGCCLFPFCIDGCKDVVHKCPNCRQQIARYNRM